MDQSLIHPIKDTAFRFACRKDLPCFTRCCANLDLVITPYDVLRLKNRLGIPSDNFLERYTTCHIDGNYGVPLVKLNMNADEKRTCPFVSPEGCIVYEDRPSVCRLYPLGRAASNSQGLDRTGEYYFLVKESHCLGFNEEKKWTIKEWLMDQGLDEYNAMNDAFIAITTGRQAHKMKKLSDPQLQMYYMAGYSLDDFRRFVFETSFFKTVRHYTGYFTPASKTTKPN